MSEPTAPATAPDAHPRVGIWIDEHPSTAMAGNYLEALRALDLAVVAIMVSGNQGFDPDWTPAWSTDELQEVGTTFHSWGAQVVLTCWPAPNKGYIDAMISGRSRHPGMKDLLAAAGAQGFEVDAEGNWSASHLDGFPTLAEAGSYLHDRMRAAAPDASLQLTTYANHPELSDESTVSQYMDVVVPQAYSINTQSEHHRKVTVYWGDEYGPGNMQVYCYKRAARIKPVGEQSRLAFGLAGYDQEFLDHDPSIHRTTTQAMQAALDAATHYCDEVRYWSSSHVIGARRNDYAAGFIAGI